MFFSTVLLNCVTALFRLPNECEDRRKASWNSSQICCSTLNPRSLNHHLFPTLSGFTFQRLDIWRTKAEYASRGDRDVDPYFLRV